MATPRRARSADPAKTRAAVSALAAWLRDDQQPDAGTGPARRRGAADRPVPSPRSRRGPASQARVPPVRCWCNAFQGQGIPVGNPPNVVETGPAHLAAAGHPGLLEVDDAAATGALTLSGSRAREIADALPLVARSAEVRKTPEPSSNRYNWSWPLLANGAGVTVARPGCGFRVELGGGMWFPVSRPVAATGLHCRAFRSGLGGSSHRAILWSLRCHTCPTPGRKALSAAPDHRGGCLVPGDVRVGVLPVLATPDTAVGGVDRQQLDAGGGGHAGEPSAEHRGRNPGHRAAEPFPPHPAAHGLPAGGPGIGEVEVFDRDRGDAVAAGVVHQLR